MTCWGIDLHSNNFVAASHSQKTTNKYLIGDFYFFNKFIQTLTPEDYIAVEASSNAFHFAYMVKDYVKEVFVVDPFKFKVVWCSMKKTDKLDAMKLSQMLELHVNNGFQLLPTVTIPPKEISQLRSLFTTYNQIKKQIVMTKNRARAITRQYLMPGLSSSPLESIGKKLDKLDLPATAKFELSLLIDEAAFLEEQKDKVVDEIFLAGRFYEKEIKILTSIHGVSVFLAIAIIADIISVGRFKNAKTFSSYLRAAPKVDNSNQTTRIGKTNKKSRKLSLGLLVQSMNHFKVSNPIIENFYNRKMVGKSAGKARMAVARKMFVTIYYMLKKEEYYYFVQQENHLRKLREYKNFLRKKGIKSNII